MRGRRLGLPLALVLAVTRVGAVSPAAGLIGELFVRTGNIKESSKYFSKVIEQQKRTDEIKIVEMAKERWNEVRHTGNLREK